MTKKEVLEAAARGEGCLGRAHDEEPVFVLVGRDRAAPAAIRVWAMFAQLLGSPRRKYRAALADVVVFESWQKDRGSKVPD
jgi:hypothetical protein